MRIYFHFLILILLFSCRKPENKITLSKNTAEVTTTKASSKIPDSIAKSSIFIQPGEGGFFRIWVKSNDKRGNYFYCDTLNILKAGKYVFDKEKVVLQKEIVLDSAVWSYLTIDSTNIKRKTITKSSYIQFATNTSFMGQAIPEQTVNFWLINTDNIAENFYLQYNGLPDGMENSVRGAFVENSAIKNNKTEKSTLYQYAKTSKLIYQPTEAEKDPNHYKNYEQKWETDNYADNHFGAGYATIPETINSTYYKENLFKLNGDSLQRIENENYIVATPFRGNLLGYDKKKKRYFPIIIESCTLSCNKTIEFTTPQKLKITYEDGATYDIGLSKIIFE